MDGPSEGGNRTSRTADREECHKQKSDDHDRSANELTND